MSDDFMSYVEKPYPITVTNSPVSGISQVRVKIYPGDGDWQVHEAGLDYTPRKWGLDLYRVGANDIVEVTYSGGLDGSAIAFFKLSILRAASREMTNQVDDVVGIKDLQTNDVQMKQTGFTEEEIRVLQRWKRKQITDLFERVGGFHNPPIREVIPCPQPYGYRNRILVQIGRAHV